MHVSIVEERRNVFRRKNTPVIQRNTRKGNRARICYYIRIFLKNFSSKPFSTIDAGSHSLSLAVQYLLVYRLILSPCNLITVLAGLQCILPVFIQIWSQKRRHLRSEL